ncbi:hemin ABC transporter substrate-binding protein [Hwanghaeella grinnelliae]|uniref:Hemin ABC transporter substrate-binding protein n=1 Tax=Hwanghaeella grinnelliae TaxID=2500179 RepID=A0A437QUT4_9PROT|nr:ABC transporter substrate-binding protein [Hwanghaeella grinnelliae]RVU38255.1 hemin ABC transporter substrate-binding protein [Hwanghaeella grinnelliae]
MLTTRFQRRQVLAGMAATAFMMPGVATGSQQHRIVSVGGSVTETIYFLDRGLLLVGSDTTSSYPEAAKNLPKVGYMRNLSVEGVLSLEPTMVLLEEGAGPPVALDSLSSIGVRIEKVDEARSIADVVTKIRRIAGLVDAEGEGDELARTVAARAKAIGEAVAVVDTRPTVLFLLDVKDGALMTAGKNTSVESIVDLAGGRLVFDEFEGFKPVTAEAVQQADPDVILLMQHVGHRLGGEEAVARLPVMAHLRAAQEGRVIAMDGLLLLGFGPRTPDAVQTLARLIHGAAAVPNILEPLRAG